MPPHSCPASEALRFSRPMTMKSLLVLEASHKTINPSKLLLNGQYVEVLETVQVTLLASLKCKPLNL